MYVLVINAGSSSLKYQIIDSETEELVTRGLCEKVGYSDAFVQHWNKNDKRVFEEPMENHLVAVKMVLDVLAKDPDSGIDSLDQIGAVGHRIVHGGEKFSESVLVDDQVVADIELCSELAPLHNPPAVQCIRACREIMPDVPHVCVFDTAFHQTMPPRAYMYAIPYEFYEQFGIRKYGAHGTSHRYLVQRASEILGEQPEDLKLITCHLGGGCSVTAVDHGMSVDTSMGFTPLGGIVMGTRSGDIDPSIVTYLMEQEGYTPNEIITILNRQSGLYGISGISADMRDIDAATKSGLKRAALAYDMFANSAKKMIGSYMAEMGGVDAIVFSGGVGENSERMRRMILGGMEPLGIVLDYEANKVMGEERVISDDRSPVKLLVIPTNEELMIARDAVRLANEANAPA